MPLVRVEVSGTDVRRFQDALALRLGAAGTVFAPVAPVRPEARMEAATPQALVVDVAGPAAADALLGWADDVRAAHPDAGVRFGRDRRQVAVDEQHAASARTDLQSLLGD